MKSIHTHYDNLKVAHNAPPEVIRAAYKSLSQRYHPDRNAGSREAERIMAIINAAYEVLADPVRRREHDTWIEEEERKSTNGVGVRGDARKIRQANTSFRGARLGTLFLSLLKLIKTVIVSIFSYAVAVGGVFAALWLVVGVLELFGGGGSPTPGPKPYQATPPAASTPVHVEPKPLPATARPYIRPSTAPNGQPWPRSAGYVRGYPRLHATGLSAVTIDNSRNDSDVFVKLVSLDGSYARPVRQFYIPAFDRFTLDKVTVGNYDIRYRDLGNGRLSRSGFFSLEETKTPDGTQYSDFTMTLYKVKHGNMQTYELSESEF